MTSNEQKILAALKQNAQLSVREIEAITGIKYSTAKGLLCNLRMAGMVYVSGSKNGDGGPGRINCWSIGGESAMHKKSYRKEDLPNIKRRRGSWHEIPLASNWLEMCHPYMGAA